MEKDKSPGLPPTSGRVPGLSSAGIATNTSNPIPESANFGQSSDSNSFSHDISKMPDNPTKKLGHRRAHSEIITLPDDLNFDSDLGVVGASDGPSYSDETEDDLFSTYLDVDKFNSSSVTSSFQVGQSSATSTPPSAPPDAMGMGANASIGVGSPPKPRVRHQHSLSMDGSTSIKPEMIISGSEETSPADSKKAISNAKLAELALIDPKRAKRIWANRQSAARSKERKMRYIGELERKIQTLQTDAASLSAQLALLQRDSNGLSNENSELKLRLQTMEQQVYLQDSLNDTLKDEIQHLKVLTAQCIANGGPMMNFPSKGANQQYYPKNNNHAMQQALLTAHQFQQLQIQSQKYQHQHQFTPRQLHQLQQQHLQQQQQPEEMRLRGSMPSPNRKDGPSSSDVSSTTSND